MPPKLAKQVKKDSMPTESVATSDVSMAALTSLLESHKVSLSTKFKTIIAALKSKIDLIHATISDHGQRISLESSADLVDGRPSTLEATCAELAASNAKLSLAAKPKPGERPRPVIIRFHNCQTKERVIREAWKMRADLQYEGKPIAFYENDIPEVVMQQALYREVMVQLYKLGLRPALQYPAKLMITAENGDKVRLSSVEEAKKYLDAKQR
ncbi:hypothetical protein KUCAC02_013783 [Chaenocephalus aceratus]|uniref:Uncharacterized protein n=1 Tax=Chaenocephalus aceratus TaxID=36190 RepID=A0ACB9WDC3_CHAAC|nr:hypothetical protein KUCAC02_013783 [Chaenocephalus aceratus]